MAIAGDMKNLAEEIESSYGARVATVQDLIKETHKTLEGFQKDHQRMAQALKTDLRQGEAQRLEDFKAMNAGLKRSVEAIVKGTTQLLSDFGKEQREMAETLRKMLAEGESARLEDFKGMLTEIQQRQKERVAEVRSRLREFRSDQEEAQKLWQNLARVMAAKRGRKAVPRPSPEVVAKPTPKPMPEPTPKPSGEKPMTYREFFAYHQPRLKGSAKEKMKKIGVMWAQYKSAQGIE